MKLLHHKLSTGCTIVAKTKPTHYRTLFISDLHLGSKAAQADLMLDFLRMNDADTIYLVGDIIDGWRLKSGWYWPQSHNDVVQKLLRKARKGTKMVYIPGNHDEFARQFVKLSFGGIEILRKTTHMSADGKKFLIMHGDEFDLVVRNARWLAYLGDWAYDLAIFINMNFNFVRRKLGFPYWSFSAWAKLKVKNAVNFIGSFEVALADEARKVGADGIICGHIHHATIRDIDGIIYMNTGDFVESCTAIAEHEDGRMEILHWHAARASVSSALEENEAAEGAAA
eukprot:gene12712-12807_t